MSNEQNHTPEPWIFGAEVGVDSTRIETASGRIIGAIVTRSVSSFEHGRPVYSWSDEGHANARRIVACVNACAGISTDVLESECSAVMGWNRTASKLIHASKQRDELLQARRVIGADLAAMKRQLDELLAALRRVAWESASYSEAVEIAKSAICETGILPPKPSIARVKGGAV